MRAEQRCLNSARGHADKPPRRCAPPANPPQYHPAQPGSSLDTLTKSRPGRADAYNSTTGRAMLRMASILSGQSGWDRQLRKAFEPCPDGLMDAEEGPVIRSPLSGTRCSTKCNSSSSCSVHGPWHPGAQAAGHSVWIRSCATPLSSPRPPPTAQLCRAQPAGSYYDSQPH